MNNVQDIVSALDNMNLSINDIRKVSQTLKRANSRAQLRAQGQFEVGDSVVFSDRRGGVKRGTVTRILRKNIEVTEESGARWRVSPSLLRRA